METVNASPEPPGHGPGESAEIDQPFQQGEDAPFQQGEIEQLVSANASTLTPSLGTVAARGALFTLSGQWLRFIVQLASTVVLARLLTPKDYGVVAAVTAFVGFAELLRDLGLSAATIQKRDLTPEQASNAFWLNVVIGLVCCAILVSCAHPLAAFFGVPQVEPAARALSLLFLINGVGAQSLAHLSREMDFRYLALTDIVSICMGAGAGILAATLGAGFWALIWMNLVIAAVKTLMGWLRCEWRPGRPVWRGTGMKQMLSFSANLTLVQVLNYFARNVDNVLIGRLVGVVSLGYYGRAYQLLMMPLQQINAPLSRVALPVLSSLQTDTIRFKRFYVTAIKLIAYTAIPLFVLSATVSTPLVVTFFGTRWRPAAPLFQILAVAGVAQALGYANGWLFVAKGRTAAQAAYALVSRPIVILSFVVGLPWGVKGLCWAYALTSLALLYPGFVMATKNTGIKMNDLLEAAAIPTAVSLLAGFATWLLLGVTALSAWSPALRLGIGCLAFAAFSISIVTPWPKARHELLDVVRSVQTSVLSRPASDAKHRRESE